MFPEAVNAGVLDYAKFVNDSGLHYTFNHFLEVLAKEN
jgi:hypothetical protein